MQAPIALGIIGFGIMGERLLRAALDHAAAHVRPVGVWDPAPAAAARLAGVAGGVPLRDSAEALIAACDCLYIAAPPAAHVPLAEAALAAGRAVFLEKPLAVDLAAATAFVARAAGARAAVNFPMASSPAVAQLGAWRDQGATGPAQSLAIEVAFATWPRGWQRDAAPWLSRRAEGGFTREVVSHFLFLARRQLGPLALQEARASFPPGDGSETAIEARLTAGGTPVSLRGGVGITDKDDHNTWTLRGPGGAIRLRDWSFAERLAEDGTWRQAPDALPNERMRPLVLQRQLAGVAAMTRGEPHHLATLQEALEVQGVVEAILAA
ncbi:Gfo/Idh/MocA family oxidoreductase [Paracraurococcus ruber]|uniref:Oxidoreductase n=1 Tax=Paracraurococcus ruber TaxID=77675 RepID=A0ABS1D4B7_9PROT|nr:Gfo/Idh/MocA family oxidoreductase [Paracraurococcus ruber]MBK1661710.1 oxidoreductase [Paracraurococcus ruber]TDG29357.1 gfo/Idh/MocA family oxidoreductase [Paracraurococcus ruber]